MEFICVLSIGGSLASYQVRKEGENSYSATLRNSSGKQDDLPAELALKKEGGKWVSQPWYEELVTGIGHAIDMAP